MSDSRSPARRTAVVVMAYGTPASTEDIEAYYTDIRRGRPPTPELLAELTGRYDAIGGVSPLAARTEEQRVAIHDALDALEPDRYTVVLGTKHSKPSIEAAVAQVVEAGFEHIVGLVLAPHYSAYSVGQYLARLRAAVPEQLAAAVSVEGVESWATEPAFVDFIAADLQRRLDLADGRTLVLFTAHSLPTRILADGDPYPDELRSTAEAVAQQLGLHEGRGWRIAWQSAGRTPEPWIGPDILTALDDIAAGGHYDTVIVSAVGFVSDHLEVLYDLDIEARVHAEQLGLGFDRTSCVNDDPRVMAALARRVHRI
jgi:ferrochelatase